MFCFNNWNSKDNYSLFINLIINWLILYNSNSNISRNMIKLIKDFNLFNNLFKITILIEIFNKSNNNSLNKIFRIKI